MQLRINERTGVIPMKRIFEKPQTVEELYEFFLYGMPLTPTSKWYRWYSSVNRKRYARRRGWQISVMNHDIRNSLTYYSGTTSNDTGWCLNVHKQA